MPILVSYKPTVELRLCQELKTVFPADRMVIHLGSQRACRGTFTPRYLANEQWLFEGDIQLENLLSPGHKFAEYPIEALTWVV